MRAILAGLAFAALLGAAPASADDPGGGRFSHEGVVELTWDKSDDADVAAATVEYAAAWRLAAGWTVQAAAVLEPVAEAGEGSSFFEDEGAYVEGLNLQYAADAFTVYGGKIAPAFGSAAGLAPGLYGAETGEAYELVEQIGLGGNVSLAGLGFELPGDHVLSLAAFMADRTALSDSALTSRGRRRLADGGPGNSDGLDSFALSLDGELQGWGYTLGVRSLAAGDAGAAEEAALVAGIHAAVPLGEQYTLEVLAEAVGVSNADGIEDAGRSFHTASAMLLHDGWRAALIVSGQHDDALAGGLDLDQTELMLGREIAPGLAIDGGLRLARTDGEEETLFGLRLTLEFG